MPGKVCPRCGRIGCRAHEPKPWAGSTRRSRTVSGWEQQRRAARVIARDRGTCHVCGQAGAEEVDHVVPLSQGGADHESNLAAIHVACHREKTQAEARAARNPAEIQIAGTPPSAVLLIVGPPASGKSALMRRLANRLHWPARSIDDCGGRGQRESRWTEMVRWMAGESGPLIAECNVLPPAVLTFLGKSDVFTVAVEVPERIRRERLEARGNEHWSLDVHAAGIKADMTVADAAAAARRLSRHEWVERQSAQTPGG